MDNIVKTTTCEKEKLKIMNTLLVGYKKFRGDFLSAFENFYCDGMDISHYEKTSNTNCNHSTNNIRHHEYLLYVNNIITWLDIKMNYCDGDNKNYTEKKAHDTIETSDTSETTKTDPINKVPNYINNNIKSSKQDTNALSPNKSKIQLPLKEIDFPNKFNSENVDGENLNEIMSEQSCDNKEAIDIKVILNHDVKNNVSVATNVNTIYQNSENQTTCTNIILPNKLIEYVDSDDSSNDEENLNTISFSKIHTVIFGNNSHVKEFASKSLKNDVTDKLNSVQKSSVCEEYTKKIDETSKKQRGSSFSGKRSNNKNNTEHISKKKKIAQFPITTVINVCNTNLVNTENNSPRVQNDHSMTSQTPKQNIDEESNLVDNLSNNFTESSTNKNIKNIYSRNIKGETKMHIACSKGNANLVTTLLRQGFNPNVKDNAGWTPMHEAVKNGQLDIVKELIEYGAYLNVPGNEYETPLQLAIKFNQLDVAKMLLENGANTKFINISENIKQCLNEKIWSELLTNTNIACKLPKIKQVCLLDQIGIFLNDTSLDSKIVKIFCQQFNVKLIKNILDEKQQIHVTHIIVPETKNNTCDESMENLIGIANGMFIVNANWISDSVKQNKILDSVLYEVNGTTSLPASYGPKKSRILTKKLYPKLLDGISVHITGKIGWKQFSVEQLKTLVRIFGGKLLTRMPDPEDSPKNKIPYHCFNNKNMIYVSTIILYTTDSCRLIKYNMEHIKAFHISWFIDALLKYTIT